MLGARSASHPCPARPVSVTSVPRLYLRSSGRRETIMHRSFPSRHARHRSSQAEVTWQARDLLRRTIASAYLFQSPPPLRGRVRVGGSHSVTIHLGSRLGTTPHPTSP